MRTKRVIHTGLYGKVSLDVLQAIFGPSAQFGSSFYRNFRREDLTGGYPSPIWSGHAYRSEIGRNLSNTIARSSVELDTTGEIIVVTSKSDYSWEDMHLAWGGRDEKECLAWLADTVKSVVKMQFGFGKLNDALTKKHDGWNATSDAKAFVWIDRMYDRMSEQDRYKSVMTDDQRNITVAQAYAVYTALKLGDKKLARLGGDTESVLGKPADPVDAEINAMIREERAKIYQEFQQKCAAARKEYQDAVNCIDNEEDKVCDEIRREYNKKIEAVRLAYAPKRDAAKAAFDETVAKLEEERKTSEAELEKSVSSQAAA